MRLGWALLALLVFCWCLFLGTQWGNPFDESEHAHAAWLMGHLHQRPLMDFFQHHPPVLWDLLKVYYLLGGEGLEVLYYGRALVVVCMVLFSLGTVLLARQLAGGVSSWPSGSLGILAMVAFCLAFPPIFTIRPETVALVFFVYAVLLWVWFGRWLFLKDFLAGALFGAAVFTSPRFVLLAGLFLILPTHPAKWSFPRWDRFVALALGAFVLVLGYSGLASYSLSAAYFNMEFTRILTGVGLGHRQFLPRLILAGFVMVLVIALVHARMNRPAKARFLNLMAYLAIVWAVSIWSAGAYFYPQNFFVPATCLALILTWAEGEVEEIRQRDSRLLVYAGTVTCSALALLLTLDDFRSAKTVMATVEQKRALLQLLGPEDRVMMGSLSHPICAPDASYYANPLLEGEDRLGTAVQLARPRWSLPDCDYLKDIIAQKPAMIDGNMLKILPRRERETLKDLLANEYEPIPFTENPRDPLFSTIYQKR